MFHHYIKRAVQGLGSQCRVAASHWNINLLTNRSITSSTMTRSQSSDGPKLSVSPAECLFDESVSVRVTGLKPGSNYTLNSSTTDSKGVPFMALVHYRADECGVIDVAHHAAIGGHYQGVQPMGLFANIIPHKTEFKHHRFSYKDVTTPCKFDLSVYKGSVAPHISVMGAEVMGLEPICYMEHQRHLLAPGVRRIPVKHGRVRGVMYLPPGPGPFPGVVDMFGSAGGLMEHRSAMLASRGVASLCLAFFAYEDLPRDLSQLDIGYFEEAVECLLSYDEVQQHGVGAIGTSKGGDLVLNMGLHIPKVKACVVVNGCIANVETELKLKDRVLPGLQFDLAKITLMRDGCIDLYNVMHDPLSYPETVLPVEDIKGHVLWFVSLDDKNWKSEYYADIASERCRAKGKAREDTLQVVKYPGAGHLIEPPYVPFCEMSYHKLVKSGMLWGGRNLEHCTAQVDAWRRMIAFFNDKLVPQQRRSKL